MAMRSTIVLFLVAPFLFACGSTIGSEQALRDHGYSDQYVLGYHDGCASGKHAGGDSFTKRARDNGAYNQGSDYKTGWDYAFVTCRNQEERDLEIARAVGAGIASASSHGADGIDTRKMLDGVDTSAIQAAGW